MNDEKKKNCIVKFIIFHYFRIDPIYMCYSNSSTSTNVQLAERYKKKIPVDLNVKPVFFASGFTFPMWRVITKDAEIQAMRWGLTPHWFKGKETKEIAAMTLNARIESIGEKPSFGGLIESQRCIIPSSGFFEWKTLGKEKIPYFVYPSKDSVFSMAGIYDHWLDPMKGEIITSFSIITSDANELMSIIHNSKKRMPAILNPNQEKDWLNGTLDHENLINPISDEFMSAHEVNRKIINSRTANCKEVLLPFDNGIYEQASLF